MFGWRWRENEMALRTVCVYEDKEITNEQHVLIRLFTDTMPLCDSFHFTFAPFSVLKIYKWKTLLFSRCHTFFLCITSSEQQIVEKLRSKWRWKWKLRLFSELSRTTRDLQILLFKWWCLIPCTYYCRYRGYGNRGEKKTGNERLNGGKRRERERQQQLTLE